MKRLKVGRGGVFPIAPTPFTDAGELDLDGQRRVLDCMVDQHVDGICILANYSEQFLLSDSERDTLLDLCLSHVAGRVPVIVTCSHFSTRIAAERARRAAAAGASMLMLMPPYHGVGLRAAAKLRSLIEAGGGVIEGPFDGEESITLMADLEAGATGTMPSALLPDLIKPVLALFSNGQHAEAEATYARILPLINFENRQCGLRATKTVMMEGGVIRSDAVRHPLAPLHPATRRRLLALASAVSPVALRWDR
jgi:2-keto-3-deoxy-L-arabinonate dehydratase